MKCSVCSGDFVAKRSDAKYCSSTCRSRAMRGISPEEVLNDMEKENEVLRQEIQSEETDPNTMTPDGQIRQVWDKEHPVPNLEGGYLHLGQTQEEYIENIPDRGYLWGGKPCHHPITYHSRCMECMAPVAITRKKI